MSTIYLVIIIFGLVATAIFMIGFAKGLRDAIIEYRAQLPDPVETDQEPYGWSAAFAVVASAVIIALPGMSAMWIYAGPLLAIVTALGCGVAFFLETPPAVAAKPS
jgi:hypothetical protein